MSEDSVGMVWLAPVLATEDRCTTPPHVKSPNGNVLEKKKAKPKKLDDERV